VEEQGEQRTPRRAFRFQFSLRSLFWLTAVVAVLCSVVFAMPNWAAVPLMALLILAFPGVLVVLLAHGGPNHRAFAIGAIFPGCVVFLVGAFAAASTVTELMSSSGAPNEDTLRAYRLLVLGGLLVTVVCGLLSLAVDKAIGGGGRGKKRH
jgi:hypothetical protein